MSIDGLLLGAILGAFIFVPIGYIVRVLLSRASDSVAQMPGVEDLYIRMGAVEAAQAGWGTSLGAYGQRLQTVESKLTLMSNEMVDFFDKTRKSEERQRGLTRRAEAAIGDEENTEVMDQTMLELMEQQRGEPPAGEQAAPMTREQYYQAKSDAWQERGL